MATGQDWGRLAEYVSAERVKLGYRTLIDFATAIGISDRTLGRLENGRSVGRNTLSVVETALKWAPGSCRAILTGGTPIYLVTDSRDISTREDPKPVTLDPLKSSPGEIAEFLEEVRQYQGEEAFQELFQQTLQVNMQARTERERGQTSKIKTPKTGKDDVR